jgi:hypothetical protein
LKCTTTMYVIYRLPARFPARALMVATLRGRTPQDAGQMSGCYLETLHAWMTWRGGMTRLVHRPGSSVAPWGGQSWPQPPFRRLLLSRCLVTVAEAGCRQDCLAGLPAPQTPYSLVSRRGYGVLAAPPICKEVTGRCTGASGSGEGKHLTRCSRS